MKCKMQLRQKFKTLFSECANTQAKNRLISIVLETKMPKLLQFCIPTYKRPETLRRCIKSIVEQTEQYELSAFVSIYVANDHSPDNTASALVEFAPVAYFDAVTRDRNLGMNANIKSMLLESKSTSDFQFIITDDDFLQPDVLPKIVEFLNVWKTNGIDTPAIWTPRYSYTEDNELYLISCRSFGQNKLLQPSAINAGRYMVNGFILSGLIVRAQKIDFEFWETYIENAYFPMIFFGDLLIRKGAFYWNMNVVHHTVLNKCHWESWGKNDLIIEIKKVSDYLNSYAILGSRIDNSLGLFSFYMTSFPSMVHAIGEFARSSNLDSERHLILNSMHEQKTKGVFKIHQPLSMLMPFALLTYLMLGLVKVMAFSFLVILNPAGSRTETYRNRARIYWRSIRKMPIVSQLFF